jgi:hypothetical protein
VLKRPQTIIRPSAEHFFGSDRMSFKDQLLLKLEIDRSARAVIRSIRPSGTMHHIDRDAMKRLLDIAGYTHQTRRGIEFCFRASRGEPPPILVLDNDLAIYNTTVDDVVLRKNPLVKEMISFRNIKKILSDTDVIVSKKEVTVREVHRQCLATLDLSFGKADLETLKMDGLVALDTGDAAGVKQSLDLFAAVLRYRPAPPFLSVAGCSVFSAVTVVGNAAPVYGPHVVYSDDRNRLLLISELVSQGEREKTEQFIKTVQGLVPADKDGGTVFSFLEEAAGHVKAISIDLD